LAKNIFTIKNNDFFSYTIFFKKKCFFEARFYSIPVKLIKLFIVMNEHHLLVMGREGDEESLYKLALNLRSRKGRKTEHKSTLNIFKRLSSSGNSVLTWFLADYYLTLSSSHSDLFAASSIYYFKRAYGQGCNLSLLSLADYYSCGRFSETAAMTLFYNMKAAELGMSTNQYIVQDGKSNIGALFRIGQHYYKTNPKLALNYFFRAAQSVKNDEHSERWTYSALYYLGLLAEKNFLLVHDFFIPKPTKLSYNRVVAIYFMRMAGTDEANDWLAARGLSERDNICAECQKPARVACTNCNLTFFCSQACFYDRGIEYHEKFCVS